MFSIKFTTAVFFKLTLLVLFLGNTALAAPQPLQLGLSAVMIGEQQDIILRWKSYLEQHLQRPVNFVQRRTYQETMDLFREDKLDAGWICGAPHMRYKSLQRLLAVGVWKGKPLYQSYLIVPKRDKSTRSIADLRGKIFGYTDPLSNSGHNVPVGEIRHLGKDPDKFFSKTMYTYSHRKLVEGVAAGLLDGANVDGYVYEQMQRFFPGLTAQTRLVQISEDYGFPPIVARIGMPDADYRALRDTLLNMHNDNEGRALLAMMGLDKFIAGDEHLYDGVAALMKEINKTAEKHAETN